MNLTANHAKYANGRKEQELQIFPRRNDFRVVRVVRGSKSVSTHVRNANDTLAVSYTRGTDLSGSLEGAGGIGGLLARTANSQLPSANAHAFYHADGDGNITYLVNSSQGLAASYRYDAYGNLVSQSGSLADANAYRFSSKERVVHDLLYGDYLYYYGYRFYWPYMQRWLNRDPIHELGGINLFGFVMNNPIQKADRFGLHWLSEFLFGDGHVCVSLKCGSGSPATPAASLGAYTYILGSGEPGGAPPQFHNLPPPGTCAAADAVYFPGGAYKVADGGILRVECDECGNVEVKGDVHAEWNDPAVEPPVRWPAKNKLPYDVWPGKTLPPGQISYPRRYQDLPVPI